MSIKLTLIYLVVTIMLFNLPSIVMWINGGGIDTAFFAPATISIGFGLLSINLYVLYHGIFEKRK